MPPLPDNLPAPLSRFIARMREIRQQRAEQGLRDTVVTAREGLEAITRPFHSRIPAIPLIRDEVIPGPDHAVPVRLYHPAPEATTDQAPPVALFVHGGGHISGSLSVYDPIARKLAAATGWLICSLDYRLAPECPYPRGLQDLMAVIKGIFPLLESLPGPLPFARRLALIGDSAGGALCASAAHLSQYEPGVSIERQVLIYPSLDYTLSQPSVTSLGKGWIPERERIVWYFDQYFRHAENRQAASPLFMPLTPAYPATLVFTAEYCPLRDEARVYVERLQAAGIPAELVDYPGMVHAFLNLEDLAAEACADLYRRIGTMALGPARTRSPGETASGPGQED